MIGMIIQLAILLGFTFVVAYIATVPPPGGMTTLKELPPADYLTEEDRFWVDTQMKLTRK